MIVYYRLCDKKSPLSKPSPQFPDNLLKLSEICLKSFVYAFRDLKPRIVFICDFCPLEYDKMIREVVPFEYSIIHTMLGINETCLLQYKMFEKTTERYALFQEYDYLWRKPLVPEYVDVFPFISPYDHPDKYEKGETSMIKVVGDQHFKSTESTTATFACHRDQFLKYKDIFYKYGYLDHQRWLDIAKEGGKLFSPIPALATHMVDEYMSPSVDWPTLIHKYLQTSP